MTKKKLIMEKALELFAKQGIESTSIQQITEHCGISKGAFYLSFKSKDELTLGLIDHFMNQIISDIDYLVRNSKDEQLLYNFYYKIFDSYYSHSDFAKIFLKEMSQTFNSELILKMRYYDQLIETIILSMIERIYGKKVEKSKYDLVYCIKGLMNTYSQLFLFYNVPIDLNLLSQSLVEKTNLLALQMTFPFLSKELLQLLQPADEKVTKAQILEVIDQKMEEVEEPIEKESLILIKQQLVEPSLSPAIVKGLMGNIRNNPHCKWISFLLRRYYEF